MNNAAFWLALLTQGQDMGQRVRLWNGYLGWELPPRIKGDEPYSGWSWPQLVVHPPDGGWPELTEEEKEIIEAVAVRHGRHPEWARGSYMDFSHCVFTEELDLSGLILVRANFDKAEFKSEVRFSRTRFYSQSFFREAVFEKGLDCCDTWFEADVYFGGSRFKSSVWFIRAEFMGGASFGSAVFEEQTKFDESRFDEMRFNRGLGLVPTSLANFKGAEFRSVASFREVLFGNDNTTYKETFPERKADSPTQSSWQGLISVERFLGGLQHFSMLRFTRTQTLAV